MPAPYIKPEMVIITNKLKGDQSIMCNQSQKQARSLDIMIKDTSNSVKAFDNITEEEVKFLNELYKLTTGTVSAKISGTSTVLGGDSNAGVEILNLVEVQESLNTTASASVLVQENAKGLSNVPGALETGVIFNGSVDEELTLNNSKDIRWRSMANAIWFKRSSWC